MEKPTHDTTTSPHLQDVPDLQSPHPCVQAVPGISLGLWLSRSDSGSVWRSVLVEEDGSGNTGASGLVIGNGRLNWPSAASRIWPALNVSLRRLPLTQSVSWDRAVFQTSLYSLPEIVAFSFAFFFLTSDLLPIQFLKPPEILAWFLSDLPIKANEMVRRRIFCQLTQSLLQLLAYTELQDVGVLLNVSESVLIGDFSSYPE